MKLPHIGPSLLIQYYESVADIAQNTPYSPVKVVALETLEVFLLTFPKALAVKLPDIRDMSRFVHVGVLQYFLNVIVDC